MLRTRQLPALTLVCAFLTVPACGGDDGGGKDTDADTEGDTEADTDADGSTGGEGGDGDGDGDGDGETSGDDGGATGDGGEGDGGTAGTGGGDSTTGGGGLGGYSMCPCADGEECLLDDEGMVMGTVCSAQCRQNSDCAAADGGEAEPNCADWWPGLSPRCVLDCGGMYGGTLECPAGMECGSLGQGMLLCVWPS